MDSSKPGDSKPLPIVKKKSTRKKFSSTGCKTGNWILPPSIPTLPDWMEPHSGEGANLSVSDSLAKTYPFLENAQESKVKDRVFSSTQCGSFAKLAPDGLSWRTSETSLFSGWEEFSGKWPVAGTMLNGVVFRQERWVRPIDEIGSGSSDNWPTPTARLGNQRGAQAKRYTDPKRSNDLDDAVAHHQERKMWPTPTGRDYKDTGDSIANGTVPVNGLLGRAVGPTKKKGSLNPAFVEYLMGYPIGWTVLKPLEIR